MWAICNTTLHQTASQSLFGTSLMSSQLPNNVTMTNPSYHDFVARFSYLAGQYCCRAALARQYTLGCLL